MIPNSVISVNNEAFRNTPLTSLVIGSGVETFGSNVFSGVCNTLQSASIDAENIPSSFLRNCSKLTTLNLGDNVKTVGNEAFEYLPKLTSLSIGNSIESIGSQAFSGAYELESIEIPDSVTSIGSSAFSGADALVTMSIGSGNKQFTSNMLGNCSGLKKLVVDSSALNSSIFSNCDQLDEIFMTSIPEDFLIQNSLTIDKLYLTSSVSNILDINLISGYSEIVICEDVDSDNDSYPNCIDDLPDNWKYTLDSDSDGLPDSWENLYLLDPYDSSDAASDNDCIEDLVELQNGLDPFVANIDIDNDGIPNAEDTDNDNDGQADHFDGRPFDPLEQFDTDNDGYTALEEYEAGTIPLKVLDIDGNGSFDALKDGLIILRFAFGLKGEALIQGALASGSLRTDAAEVEAYLNSLVPSF